MLLNGGETGLTTETGSCYNADALITDRIEEGAMTTETVRLRTGEQLIIKTLLPPLP